MIVHRKFLDRHKRVTTALWVVVVATLLCGACRSEKEEPSVEVPVETKSDILEFPLALHVEDESVNAFVTKAMIDCASGDYDRFRLLWSAREEPLARGEYDRGWQAVEEIRVRALEKIILKQSADDGLEKSLPGYVILADVSLDPNHRATMEQPNRAVVLTMTREHQQWRLSSAPEDVRRWVKQRVTSGAQIPKGDSDRPAPDVEPG